MTNPQFNTEISANIRIAKAEISALEIKLASKKAHLKHLETLKQNKK